MLFCGATVSYPPPLPDGVATHFLNGQYQFVSISGGGGDTIWTTNSAGWITPNGSGQVTNTLAFISGLQDNTDNTNVASFVDTANFLSSDGQILFGVYNHQTNVALFSRDGGILIGANAIAHTEFYTGDAAQYGIILQGYHNPDLGDNDFSQIIDEVKLNNGSQSRFEEFGQHGSRVVDWFVHNTVSGNNGEIFGSVSETNVVLRLQVGAVGTDRTRFFPSSGSSPSEPSYLFDLGPVGSTSTTIAHTKFANLGTNLVSIYATGILEATGGFSSLATDAAVAITSTGITNALGKNARCLFDGTAMTFTVKDTGNSPWYTNTVAVGHAEVTLQNGEAVTISGTGVTGVLKAW